MTRAIAYPATLPNVTPTAGKDVAMGVVSEKLGQIRGRHGDTVENFDASWEIPYALAAAWRTWHKVALLEGQLKCAIPLPTEFGMVPMIAQFAKMYTEENIVGYGVRISAPLVVTGVARP